jgi:hypothetical protein
MYHGAGMHDEGGAAGDVLPRQVLDVSFKRVLYTAAPDRPQSSSSS